MNTQNGTKIVRGIVGQNIYALRSDKGYSQLQLADTAGINRTYLSDIETGKGNATIDVLTKIANGLDVPITRLFRGAESVTPCYLTGDEGITSGAGSVSLNYSAEHGPARK